MAEHDLRDPLIQELFPYEVGERVSKGISSEGMPLSNDLLDAPPDYYRLVLDLDQGSYDLAIVRSFYLAYAMPSQFAQQNLLYLQLLASELTSADHYTVREGLRSYLCAQTFAGEGELEYEGRRYRLTPGDAFLIDCMRPHAYRSVSPAGWGYRIIHFAGSPMEGIFTELLNANEVVFHFDEGDRWHRLTKDLFASRRRAEPDCELREHEALTGMMACLLRRLPRYRTAEGPEEIIALRHYLDEHCVEPLTLDTVAAHAHLSKYHLSRLFKRHVGKTVLAYVTERRMDIATFLLTSSDQTVEEIARACGYTSANSFLYAFKKQVGVSPRAYRKQRSR